MARVPASRPTRFERGQAAQHQPLQGRSTPSIWPSGTPSSRKGTAGPCGCRRQLREFAGRRRSANAASSVRNLGVKTFYRKGDRWVDSQVKPEEDARAVVLEQFSDDFFQLARGQSAEQNQYLTFEEPVTVLIDGQVYRVDPPKAR